MYSMENSGSNRDQPLKSNQQGEETELVGLRPGSCFSPCDSRYFHLWFLITGLCLWLTKTFSQAGSDTYSTTMGLWVCSVIREHLPQPEAGPGFHDQNWKAKQNKNNNNNKNQNPKKPQTCPVINRESRGLKGRPRLARNMQGNLITVI